MLIKFFDFLYKLEEAARISRQERATKAARGVIQARKAREMKFNQKEDDENLKPVSFDDVNGMPFPDVAKLKFPQIKDISFEELQFLSNDKKRIIQDIIDKHYDEEDEKERERIKKVKRSLQKENFYHYFR